MTKTVSIAMCTYNGARFVGAQLDSIIDQTRQPDELVVCDDGSTDDTIAIVESFRAQSPFPVRIFKNETNLQPYRNFEQALSRCVGDAVFFCDQDDIWLSSKIANMVDRLNMEQENSRSDMPLLLYSDMEIVDGTLKTLAESFVCHFGVHTAEPDLLEIMRVNVVSGCASLLNKSLINSMLPFPEPPSGRSPFLHDWWGAICATALGKIIFIDEKLVRYRIHENNTVGKLEYRREPWRVSLFSSDKIGIYDRLKQKNTEGKLKLATQIELAKMVVQAMLSKQVLDLGCPTHRYISDVAKLCSGSAVSRIPTIWRTRRRGSGLLKNLRRAIRIMEL